MGYGGFCTKNEKKFRFFVIFFRGGKWKGGGDGSIFLPSAACGGGCERDSGRGGWSVSDDVWDFATPQKFALRIFTPPRKRRRVRFRLSPEWNMEREWKGGGMEVFFYPPPLAGGGASAIAVAGGGVLPMMFGTSPPPKNSPCEFLPPPQAAEGEIPAFAGMEVWVLGRGRQRLHCTAYYLPGKTTSSVFRNSGVTCAPAPLSL